MPAAAVIPAPIAYIKVVAVKKLVVGSVSGRCRTTLAVRRVAAGRVAGPRVPSARPSSRSSAVSGC
ncbi:MAG: hypothetical protein DI616_20640 [Paracoccus denitrificans]|uniref:Uncharacterized protein n=1 Tax=Paracoccus denitrificans TaxID=266 RepID=A0A533HRS0_PARDE|nr:MAG: hypothetical protein DI616_20640 [Paracoccus denitrificans]